MIEEFVFKVLLAWDAVKELCGEIPWYAWFWMSVVVFAVIVALLEVL